MLSDDQKREFALRYLEYRRDAAKAAARLFPHDIASRMWALTELPFDPFVVQECERLLAEHGYERFLPDKFEVASMLYNTAEQAKSPDDKVKAAKAYAEIMGFIDKSGAVNVDARTLVDNRSVIVVRDFGTDDDWERKAVEQQRRLIDDATNDNRAAA